ncbi:MAG: hypothetical protein H0T47_15235 [Planctomycetaceae bacterium]|nr:hypothetical protein [Planctomycetaceae bacterium]
MIVASWIVAGVVAAAAVADMAIAFPFNRQIVMDVMFLLGAGLVAYLAFDAFKDIR